MDKTDQEGFQQALLAYGPVLDLHANEAAVAVEKGDWLQATEAARPPANGLRHLPSPVETENASLMDLLDVNGLPRSRSAAVQAEGGLMSTR